jgi:hypothetical protein
LNEEFSDWLRDYMMRGRPSQWPQGIQPLQVFTYDDLLFAFEGGRISKEQEKHREQINELRHEQERRENGIVRVNITHGIEESDVEAAARIRDVVEGIRKGFGEKKK